MKIIAHRGASGEAPENTEAAVILAAQQGFNWIEFDIRTSKDNAVVVVHDSDIERTSNGKGLVRELTLAELSQYDFGSWFADNYQGQPILTFARLIELAKQYNLVLQVELKPDVGDEERLITAMQPLIATNPNVRFEFSSFNFTAIEVLATALPDSSRALLYDDIPDNWQADLQHYGANAIHCWNKMLTGKSLRNGKDVIDQGITLRVYTVNELEDAKKLKDLGVDAIFSDYPQRMQNL